MNTIECNPQTFFDYSIFGSMEDERMNEVYNADALGNSLRLWLSSKRGDFVGGRTRGGFVTRAIGKPMNTISVERVRSAIVEGLKNDFRPTLEIVNLEVIPDIEKKRWGIILEAYSPELNVTITLNEKLKGEA